MVISLSPPLLTPWNVFCWTVVILGYFCRLFKRKKLAFWKICPCTVFVLHGMVHVYVYQDVIAPFVTVFWLNPVRFLLSYGTAKWRSDYVKRLPSGYRVQYYSPIYFGSVSELRVFRWHQNMCLIEPMLLTIVDRVLLQMALAKMYKDWSHH